jgi:hypothetical protein
MFVSLFFAPYEYALVVSLLRAQQMEHNARQFVSRGRNRLWLAQFSGDLSKEFAKIVVRVMERIGCRKLTMELRYGALRGQGDPRLANLEFLKPGSFAAYVADVLIRDDRSLSRTWRDRPLEDVQHDPRFIAHTCGFDSQIILHMAQEAAKSWEGRIAEPEPELDLEITDHRNFEEVVRGTNAACEDLPDAVTTPLDERDDKQSEPR